MQVPDARHVRQLGERLNRATGDGDWDELRRIDAEVAQLVRQLEGQVPQHLATAWPPLAQAHAQALRTCDEALASMAERMTELPTRRAAGRAYAGQDGEGA